MAYENRRVPNGSLHAHFIERLIDSFAMSHAQIRDAIARIDFAVLTEERIEALAKCAPTDEEVTTGPLGCGHDNDSLLAMSAVLSAIARL